MNGLPRYKSFSSNHRRSPAPFPLRNSMRDNPRAYRKNLERAYKQISPTWNRKFTAGVYPCQIIFFLFPFLIARWVTGRTSSPLEWFEGCRTVHKGRGGGTELGSIRSIPSVWRTGFYQWNINTSGSPQSNHRTVSIPWFVHGKLRKEWIPLA